MSNNNDSEKYKTKKEFLKNVMTIYGRKPVLEALKDQNLNLYRLHLANSNKQKGIIEEIISCAKKRHLDIVYHDKNQLSRISKNGKQDQGVCLDIMCPQHQDYQNFLNNINPRKTIRLIALDRITNPQNLGMIIRSVCASGIDGLLLPASGCARLDSLVIKASTGTLFKTSLLHCNKLDQALFESKKYGAKILGLSSHATTSISEMKDEKFIIYVLGNETDGVSDNVTQYCDELIKIPMSNGVESLNVAVTASLLAFKEIFH